MNAGAMNVAVAPPVPYRSGGSGKANVIVNIQNMSLL